MALLYVRVFTVLHHVQSLLSILLYFFVGEEEEEYITLFLDSKAYFVNPN